MFLKRKVGRRRMRNPSHGYTPVQWKAHQTAFIQTPEEVAVLKFLKKFGLEPLLNYSNLGQTVRGKTPACWGSGDWGSLAKCEKCKRGDPLSSVFGFFDPNNGSEIGVDSYGKNTTCLIATWVRHFRSELK